MTRFRRLVERLVDEVRALAEDWRALQKELDRLAREYGNERE